MLKFLLLILLLGLVFFLLGVKHSRPASPRKESPEPAPSAAPQNMSSCAHCGLHLPADETLPGRGGLFCSASHRAAYEAEHGGAA